MFEFGNLARLTIDPTGRWITTYASCGEFTRQNWDEVWNMKFIDIGWSMNTMVAGNAQEMAQFAFSIADYILSNSLWDASRSEWTINIE